MIKLKDLRESPYQSRIDELTVLQGKSFENRQLEELAASIRESGLMTPIIVRQMGELFEIIDGHRRVMAHRLLGRGQIRAIVKQCDEREALVMSVVGNLQRKNLNTIELALSYQKLLDSGIFADKRELSRSLGKDETYVGDLLKTLNMDRRIVNDLKNQHAIKDMKILRLIRRKGDVDENGKSQAQYKLYVKAKMQKLSRKDVAKLIAGQNNKNRKELIFKANTSSLNVRIPIKHLSKDKQIKLQELIATQLDELLSKLDE